MFLHFDKTKLHLQAVVGILEEYKPSDKIKETQAKLTELKSKIEDFQNNIIFPVLQEIEKVVTEENNKYSGPKEHVTE